MPGFTTMGGFTHTPELAYAIITDLIAQGFVLKFPATPLPAPVAGTPYAGFKATLEVGATADPLAATQPWRIQFDTTSENQMMDIQVASPLQLPNDGTTAILDQKDFSSPTQIPNVYNPIPSGRLRTDDALIVLASGQTVKNDDSMNHFISRNWNQRVTSDQIALSYPMTYSLSVANHGIVLCVSEDATDPTAVPNTSWMVVQRMVDRANGSPVVAGKSPVLCLFALKNRPYKFVVRESDVLKPTLPVKADSNTPDSHAIINSKKQVTITENNMYVLNFPNGINTPRYMYTDELDLLAYTSADVISQNSDVPITVYGEAAPRLYKALGANLGDNQGMRPLMCIQGAGIP